MRDEAALRTMFEQADAEASGSIDLAKFTSLVRKLGLRLTDAKAAKAFLSLDPKGEDGVTFEQLSAWWFKYDRP